MTNAFLYLFRHISISASEYSVFVCVCCCYCPEIFLMFLLISFFFLLSFSERLYYFLFIIRNFVFSHLLNIYHSLDTKKKTMKSYSLTIYANNTYITLTAIKLTKKRKILVKGSVIKISLVKRVSFLVFLFFSTFLQAQEFTRLEKIKCEEEKCTKSCNAFSV